MLAQVGKLMGHVFPKILKRDTVLPFWDGHPFCDSRMHFALIMTPMKRSGASNGNI